MDKHEPHQIRDWAAETAEQESRAPEPEPQAPEE